MTKTDAYCQEMLAAMVEDTVKSVEDAASKGEIAEYLEDTLDVKITIDGNLRYCGAEVTVAWGGPNIYIDTQKCNVSGYWGSLSWIRRIDEDACDEIDDYFEDYYTCCR